MVKRQKCPYTHRQNWSDVLNCSLLMLRYASGAPPQSVGTNFFSDVFPQAMAIFGSHSVLW
jgi:hypothetical protein